MGLDHQPDEYWEDQRIRVYQMSLVGETHWKSPPHMCADGFDSLDVQPGAFLSSARCIQSLSYVILL